MPSCSLWPKGVNINKSSNLCKQIWSCKEDKHQEQEKYSSLIYCSWGGRSDLRWKVAEGSPIANMAASNSSQAVGLWWGARVFSQITLGEGKGGYPWLHLQRPWRSWCWWAGAPHYFNMQPSLEALHWLEEGYEPQCGWRCWGQGLWGVSPGGCHPLTWDRKEACNQRSIFQRSEEPSRI